MKGLKAQRDTDIVADKQGQRTAKQSSVSFLWSAESMRNESKSHGHWKPQVGVVL